MSVALASAYAIPLGFALSALFYLLKLPNFVVSYIRQYHQSESSGDGVGREAPPSGKRHGGLGEALRVLFAPIAAICCSIYLYLSIDGILRLMPIVCTALSFMLFSVLLRAFFKAVARMIACPIIATRRLICRIGSKKAEKRGKNMQI